MRVEIERGIEQRQCPPPDTAPRFARACGRQTRLHEQIVELLTFS